MKKRFLAAFLSIIMIISAIPLMSMAVSVDDYWNDDYEYDSERKFVYKECTDFVACRLYKANGVYFTNKYGEAGVKWGDAGNWDDTARANGITVDDIPSIGAVAQMHYEENGHVAWVAAIVDENTIIIEDYNGKPPKGHMYNCREVPKTSYQYIHINDSGTSGLGVNLGDDFYACFVLTYPWKSLENKSGNLQVAGNPDYTDKKQIWHFQRQKSGTYAESYKITNVYDNTCLTAANSGREEGTNVCTQADNNSASQQWYIYKNGSGYAVVSAYCKLVFDAAGGATSEGTNIQLWTRNWTEAQCLSIKEIDSYSGEKPSAPSVKISSNSVFTGEEVTLSWGAVSGATEYIVTAYDKSNNQVVKENVGNKTTWTRAFKDAGTYSIYVSASNSAGTSTSKAVSLTVNSATKVTVTFNAKGGKCDTASKTVAYKGTYGTLPTPERKEYRFLGWSTTGNEKYIISENTVVNNSGSHVLYAVWDGPGAWGEWSSWSTTAVSETPTRQVEKTTDTVSYNMITYCCGNSSGQRCYLAYMQDGYTLRTGEPYEETWSAATFKSAASYSQGSYFDFYDGDSVDGYIIGPGTAYVAADGYLPFFVASKSDGTKYRYREWKNYTEYTVTFNANGGKVGVFNTPTTSRSVRSGGTVSNIPEPTYDGYTFLGWYTQKEGGVKLTSSTVINSNCKYYAHWADDSCAAGNHNFGEWKIIKEPTCTENGEEERVCAVCGYSEKRDIEKTGHDFSVLESDGNGHRNVCANCGEKLEIKAHEYGEETVIKSAACTEDGEAEHTCAVCGYTVTETVEKLGHIPDEIEYDDLYHWYECTNCGEITDIESHKFGDTKITKAASENERGKAERKCTVCGYIDVLTIGDCNCDKEIDNKDVVFLFRYASVGTKDDDETLLDFNGDGEVNNKDVVELFRYVSAR